MYKIEQYEIIISYFEQRIFFGNKMNMKYVIYKARSEKYKLSAVSQMQRMLNEDCHLWKCKDLPVCNSLVIVLNKWIEKQESSNEISPRL